MKNIDKDWRPLISSFLQDVIRLVLEDDLKIRHLESFETPLKLWRMAGDEVLFYSDKLFSANQIKYISKLINHSVRHLDEKYKNEYSLGAKATLWLAGFPKRNTEIIVSSQSPFVRFVTGEFDIIEDHFSERIFDASDDKLDFLGPEIDLGFRLASLAKPNRVIVSLDTAYQIACSRSRLTAQPRKAVA